MNISKLKIVKFFPYEKAHVQTAPIVLKDENNAIYMALEKALRKIDCSMDNKVTIQAVNNLSQESIYLTYWDGMLHIGSKIHEF